MGQSSCARSGRQSKNQSRRDKWLATAQNAALKLKYRKFLGGYDSFRESCEVHHEDIEKAMHTANSQGCTDYGVSEIGATETSRINQAREVEYREMQRTVELLQDGGVGYLSEKKRNGWVRLMFENFNSLGVFTQQWKLDRLKYLIKHLHVDILAGCEIQCDWSFMDQNSKFVDLLANGQALKGLASHNTNERIQREQMGGTAITAIGRLTDMVTSVGADPTGLGRWSWLRLSGEQRSTRVVSAYLPCKPGRAARGRTVWEQHKRFFEAKGDFRYPSTILIEDLTEAIRTWQREGDEVVLAMDANQNVYDGLLSASLRDLCQMSCLFEPILGERLPNSHFRGNTPISTIFGTSGLVTNNAMCYPHWFGVGDHRVFVIEMSAASLFGGEFPTIASPMARTLNCKITRIRLQYCRKLSLLARRHKMAIKLDQIESLEGAFLDKRRRLHIAWDKEWGELMTSAERNCNKFKSCSLEYSPTVGQWLKRRSVLKWILKWHDGRVPDSRNMCRAARRVGIETPLTLSRADVEARLHACLEELFKLKTQAPELRRQHLRWRLSIARANGEEETEKEILRIIKAEARRKKQRAINKIVRTPRGRSVIRVQTNVDGVETSHDTRRSVERACQQHLGNRFSLGSRAPIGSGEIARAIGPLGETEVAQLILDSTLPVPSSWDKVTVDLLRAAAQVRLEMNDIPAHTSGVTETDFHSFWLTARESTSSSKSGRHFGHYKAACSDSTLVSLHVRNINLAAMRGQPLPRWKQGVTVLLEKVAGNNNIAKLRAICLLEADFNWWLKVFFAKRMMYRMCSQKLLPAEQGASPGKTTIDSVMLKQLFFDQSNVLHISCAISSNDAANCYDAVNHAAGSIALQAMRVPLHIVLCYLLAIQTMRFYLKTGFGMAKRSYGGTSTNPFMGLTQGSGASPAAWTAISTLIVTAYKEKGHGAGFYAAWSGIFIALAALLYVDDTDLLHVSCSPEEDDTEFVGRIQAATYYWAELLQATGGSLKPAKCYWYLVSFKFVRGRATHKTLRDLRHLRLNIPQPNSEDVEIELRDSTTASEVLGVWTSPSGVDGKHLLHMMDKGNKWARRVMASTLTPAEVWQSFKTQAWPSVTYGLVPMLSPLATLDRAFSNWYFSFLPALGVNRNIAREWRTLPTSFQGLGLPNISLEKLSASLQYLQRHWGCHSSYGIALRSTFELIQVETGLSGNFLLRNYSKFGLLASHTWFKILWEYLDHYKVALYLDGIEIPPVRERDKVFMEEVIKLTPPCQWKSINRCRHFFQVYFTSQLVLSDGITVDPQKLRLVAQPASQMKFPKESPTLEDLALWKDTIALMTSPTYRMSPRLGKFLRFPYDSVYWSTSSDGSVLVKHTHGLAAETYLPTSGRYNTRNSGAYTRSNTPPPLGSDFYVVSVKQTKDSRVSVHSRMTLQDRVDEHPRTLKEIFSSWDNDFIWKNLELSGNDDGWLRRAYSHGTLVLCHDGSYMPHQDGTLCSAAVIAVCTYSAQQAQITFCEHTDEQTASNYRGEIIGGVMATLILRALSQIAAPPPTTHPVPIYCDNLGVVCHGNAFLRPLPERQVQQDVLYLLKRNLSALPHPVSYRHVYGHLDDCLSFSSLTLPQQLNVMADLLAKTELQRCISLSTGSPPSYPLEPVSIQMGGKKITASIKTSLYYHWGRNTARELFERKHIVSRFNFSRIYWEGVHRAMADYPQMFRTWTTKQISGWGAVNRRLAKYDETVDNVCPCCGKEDESATHITRCPDPGRKIAFKKSVQNLLSWMEESHADEDMISCLGQYLDSAGEGSMTEIAGHYSHLCHWAQEHDILGWDNFVEGRIGTELIALQRKQLHDSGSRQHISNWAGAFVSKVLAITHSQWVYRNTKVHLRLVEGKTLIEHEEVMEEVLRLLATDPEDICPQHRSLLEIDFEKLGSGSTADRQYWVANMSSSISAARFRHDSQLSPSGSNLSLTGTQYDVP